MARKRPIFHEELGGFFRALREARLQESANWTLRGAASIAKRRSLRLTYQVLFRLERGQVKNPDPETMRAIAELYGLAYEDVVRRYVAARYGLSITGTVTTTGEIAEPQREGQADVQTAAHLRELERRIAADDDAFAAVQDIATHLLDMVVAHVEGHGPRTRPTTRRKSGLTTS